MKFELNDFHRNISEEELITDLKSVYEKLLSENCKLTFRSYNENGKYNSSTIQVRFKTWNNALEKAGINRVSSKNDYSKSMLIAGNLNIP